MTKHITRFKIASRSGARGWKCRECVNADQRAYYAKTQGKYRRGNSTPLAREIAHRRVPDAELFDQYKPVKCYRATDDEWVDALWIGERPDGTVWCAVMSRPANPLVAPFKRGCVAVERTAAA